VPSQLIRCVPVLAQNTPRHDELSRRGTVRDDVRPGLRITHYKKRTVIAFDVDSENVSIIGIFYGGQDYETILQDDSEDGSAH
jgi:toxin ParE1/3/4